MFPLLKCNYIMTPHRIMTCFFLLVAGSLLLWTGAMERVSLGSEQAYFDLEPHNILIINMYCCWNNGAAPIAPQFFLSNAIEKETQGDWFEKSKETIKIGKKNKKSVWSEEAEQPIRRAGSQSGALPRGRGRWRPDWEFVPRTACVSTVSRSMGEVDNLWILEDSWRRALTESARPATK